MHIWRYSSDSISRFASFSLLVLFVVSSILIGPVKTAFAEAVSIAGQTTFSYWEIISGLPYGLKMETIGDGEGSYTGYKVKDSYGNPAAREDGRWYVYTGPTYYDTENGPVLTGDFTAKTLYVVPYRELTNVTFLPDIVVPPGGGTLGGASYVTLTSPNTNTKMRGIALIYSGPLGFGIETWEFDPSSKILKSSSTQNDYRTLSPGGDPIGLYVSGTATYLIFPDYILRTYTSTPPPKDEGGLDISTVLKIAAVVVAAYFGVPLDVPLFSLDVAGVAAGAGLEVGYSSALFSSIGSGYFTTINVLPWISGGVAVSDTVFGVDSSGTPTNPSTTTTLPTSICGSAVNYYGTTCYGPENSCKDSYQGKFVAYAGADQNTCYVCDAVGSPPVPFGYDPNTCQPLARAVCGSAVNTTTSEPPSGNLCETSGLSSPIGRYCFDEEDAMVGCQSKSAVSSRWNWSCALPASEGSSLPASCWADYEGPISVTGVCGSAQGQTFGAAPNANLCSKGTPGTVFSTNYCFNLAGVQNCVNSENYSSLVGWWWTCGPSADGVSTAKYCGALYSPTAVVTNPTPEEDVCPNIADKQTFVPSGYQKDASGNCVQLVCNQPMAGSRTLNSLKETLNATMSCTGPGGAATEKNLRITVGAPTAASVINTAVSTAYNAVASTVTNIVSTVVATVENAVTSSPATVAAEVASPPPPAPAVCGSATTGSFSNAPTQDLCGQDSRLDGEVSKNALSTKYVWTCASTATGGAPASCSADRAVLCSLAGFDPFSACPAPELPPAPAITLKAYYFTNAYDLSTKTLLDSLKTINQWDLVKYEWSSTEAVKCPDAWGMSTSTNGFRYVRPGSNMVNQTVSCKNSSNQTATSNSVNITVTAPPLSTAFANGDSVTGSGASINVYGSYYYYPPASAPALTSTVNGTSIGSIKAGEQPNGGDYGPYFVDGISWWWVEFGDGTKGLVKEGELKKHTEPPAVTLFISPNPSVYGSTANFSWTSSSGVDSCSAPWTTKTSASGSESVAVSSSGSVSNSSIYDVSYYIDCKGKDGTTIRDTEVLTVVPPVSDGQALPTGTYTRWVWPQTDNGYDSFEWDVKSNRGTTATSYYYANQFWLQNGSTAYAGIQRYGDGTTWAIFSIWGALDSELGAGNTGRAAPFSGEGTGQSTLISYPWVADRTYHMRIAKLASDSTGQWWGAWIKDTVTQREIMISKIKVPAFWGGMTGTQSWIERFGPAALSSCSEIEFTDVLFINMTATRNSASVVPESHLNWFNDPPHCPGSYIIDVPGGVRQQMGASQAPTSLRGEGSLFAYVGLFKPMIKAIQNMSRQMAAVVLAQNTGGTVSQTSSASDIQFTSDKTSVDYNGSATINWSVPSGYSCNIIFDKPDQSNIVIDNSAVCRPDVPVSGISCGSAASATHTTNPTADLCGNSSLGRAGVTFNSTNKTYNWMCESNLSAGSVSCSAEQSAVCSVPIIGSLTCPATAGDCSVAHYDCDVGTKANEKENAGTWTWTCNGINIDSNASCTENKTSPDVCSNLTGIQTVVPVGYSKNTSGDCVPDGVDTNPDFCPNISSAQPAVPAGYIVNSGGDCVPSTTANDYCPNIDGIQTAVPADYTVNSSGDCVREIIVEPPDICPNISGVQTAVPSGYELNATGDCVPKNKDYCPNIAGIQTAAPAGYTVNSSGECVTGVIVDDIDLCTNIDGFQTSVPSGYARNSSGVCIPSGGTGTTCADGTPIPSNGECPKGTGGAQTGTVCVNGNTIGADCVTATANACEMVGRGKINNNCECGIIDPPYTAVTPPANSYCPTVSIGTGDGTTGTGSTDSSGSTVYVNLGSVESGFWAEPNPVLFNKTVKLSWNASGVRVSDKDCRLAGVAKSGKAMKTLSNLPAKHSTNTDRLVEDTDFTLSCSNGVNSASKTITVKVLYPYFREF